jgi:hypothetical protein
MTLVLILMGWLYYIDYGRHWGAFLGNQAEEEIRTWDNDGEKENWGGGRSRKERRTD